MKRPITIGFLGHVDAGKTSLIHALLSYSKGQKLPQDQRDHNSFQGQAGPNFSLFPQKQKDEGRPEKEKLLDSDSIEKRRGLTIFSKEARFTVQDQEYILIDTPGHQDFAPEMNRILPVLDLAILLLDAQDGVLAFTKTLWRRLKEEKIPLFLAINKVDLGKVNRKAEIQALKEAFGEGVVSFQEEEAPLKEALAMASPILMEKYFQEGDLSYKDWQKEIRNRVIFPLFFLSAVQGQGLADLFKELLRFSPSPSRNPSFQVMVYKISFDEKNTRLSHICLFSGSVRAKETLGEEKIHELRCYNGESYQTLPKISAGQIACLVGPSHLYSGQWLGEEKKTKTPFRPIFRYRMRRKDGGAYEELLRLARKYQDIFPEMKVQGLGKEEAVEFFAMGPLFLEIIEEKFREEGILLAFSTGKLDYRETIEGAVVGVGHFEPLRHYAEVHLLLEAAERNQGKTFSCPLPVDPQKASLIRVIEEAVQEDIPGVLTGSPLTDVHITLLSFKDTAHSQAQDFRRATRRAIRQGLMEAKAILLEPELTFSIDLPLEQMGRVYQELTGLFIEDLEDEIRGEEVRFLGHGPASVLSPYFTSLPRQSRGKAKIDLWPSGDIPCPNPEEVIEKMSYDPLEDQDFPPGSIFCSHGAGFSVPWDQVKSFASLPVEKGREKNKEGWMDQAQEGPGDNLAARNARRPSQEKNLSIGQDEISQIFRETFYANTDREKAKRRAEKYQDQKRKEKILEKKKENGQNVQEKTQDQTAWLLVDGYNIVHEWPGLRELVESNLDQARSLFIDQLSEFSALIDSQIVVVFDAYQVKGGKRSITKRGGVYVVFTQEAETADQYIEAVARNKCPHDHVTIASSDGPVQLIGFKEGASILPARKLIESVISAKEKTVKDFQKTAPLPLSQKIPNPDKTVPETEDKEKG